MGKDRLNPGEAHVGEFGGRLIIKSFNFTRPANTTPYAVKDSVNVDLLVTAATNASPIVVTTSAHGLADRDYVTISNVVGNTNANGSFHVKMLTPTTFSLYSDKALTTPVAGNGAWISGGDVARLFRLPGILRIPGGGGYLVKVQSFTNLATFTDQHVLHFYNSPVAAILDNSPYTLLDVYKDKRLGFITLPAFATEGAGSDMASALACGSISPILPLPVANFESPADYDLWCRIETLSGGTPASAQTFMHKITVEVY